MEKVLHECIYGHQWHVLFPHPLVYANKSLRFCMECLEENRIEIASIKLTTSGYSMLVLEYECPTCFKITRMPLIPDSRFMGITMIQEGMEMEDFYTPKVGWYRLPHRWSTLCECPPRVPTRLARK